MNQFSLRTLFVVMSFIACDAAWLYQYGGKRSFALYALAFQIPMLAATYGIYRLGDVRDEYGRTQPGHMAVAVAIIVGAWYGIVSQGIILGRLPWESWEPTGHMVATELTCAAIAFGGISGFSATFVRVLLRWTRGPSASLRIAGGISGGFSAFVVSLVRASEDVALRQPFTIVVVTVAAACAGYLIGSLGRST